MLARLRGIVEEAILCLNGDDASGALSCLGAPRESRKASKLDDVHRTIATKARHELVRYGNGSA